MAQFLLSKRQSSPSQRSPDVVAKEPLTHLIRLALPHFQAIVDSPDAYLHGGCEKSDSRPCLPRMSRIVWNNGNKVSNRLRLLRTTISISLQHGSLDHMTYAKDLSKPVTHVSFQASTDYHGRQVPSRAPQGDCGRGRQFAQGAQGDNLRRRDGSRRADFSSSACHAGCVGHLQGWTDRTCSLPLGVPRLILPCTSVQREKMFV